HYITHVTLGAASKEEVLQLSKQVDEALMKHYREGIEDETGDDYEGGRYRDYYVYTPEKELGELNKILRILSIGLGGIAGISLLVGGIGIMNIMFVSVTERTKEIGIRKAIGAKRRTIVSQFLVEAAIVSGIGGIIGLLLAGIVGYAVGVLTPLKPEIKIHVMILAVAFSAFIGIVFGIYPANKAAKLKPIDALRFE
ncbi:MAG: FtsX-like permease family protein, partial [Clostridia bacterium]|nr:FtsX-like permease family protein [Clostridia bacterium]